MSDGSHGRRLRRLSGGNTLTSFRTNENDLSFPRIEPRSSRAAIYGTFLFFTSQRVMHLVPVMQSSVLLQGTNVEHR